MQLIEVTPYQLESWPGFHDSVAALRAEVELPQFAGDATYDVDKYATMHAAGSLSAFAVVAEEAELRAWGLLIHVKTARREQPLYVTDAMWSADPEAGHLLMQAMLRAARRAGAPLGITAPVGGRLDKALQDSPHAKRTHNVYTLATTMRR